MWDAADGFILGGFPRTENQALDLEELLDSMEKPLDVAILMDVDLNVLLKRLTGRRLDIYRQRTEPLIEFYRSRGKLKTVLAEGSIDAVYQRLLGVL